MNREPLSLGVKAILITLSIVYLLELTLTGSFSPRPNDLIEIGGTIKSLTQEDSIYWLRIFTALFLHGSLIHLISNSIGLLIGGSFLEEIIGKYWFWAIFLISGAIGPVFSLLLTDSHIVSIGASGGIMGIFSSALLITNTKVKSPLRKQLNIYFGQALIPSLIPISRHVDYAAHFGGVIGGICCGLIMLCFWAKNENYPQGNLFAIICSILFLACSSLAIFKTIWLF